MKLGLVYARARNGVIGRGGELPWRLPEDLAHFKQVTLGHPVIMGRKTWESVPPRFRPLPGRVNVVVTRQAGWEAPGAVRASSLAQAIDACAGAPEVWVIGGAGLFEEALPQADVLELTEIDADYEGDTYAPPLGPQWLETRRSSHMSASGIPYSFVTYTQRRGD